jgi:hypothetical protein
VQLEPIEVEEEEAAEVGMEEAVAETAEEILTTLKA